ncbi:hypothetical protein O9H85_28050 [Paenibacillus filicis]|uniref:Inositol monophosphatase n=1 Tax=Paenibacillus gyeongsangnamensis TaxID=3388067 RepID=A0ABT4QH03_9BACL|nr:hypothetical protein [Paenibacillus filicis]MCZ8516177.1 hypothetical protein [Paenibacillus filicis]
MTPCLEFGSDMYDLLADALIVREARAKVTGMDCRDFTWGSSGIVPANDQLHAGILAALRVS